MGCFGACILFLIFPAASQILWQYLLEKQTNRVLFVRYNHLSSQFRLSLKQKQIAAVSCADCN